MSSTAHESQGSDKAWAIGSALVFGPAALYLLSPSASKQAHHAQQASLPKEKASNPDAAPVPTTPPPQEHAPVEPAPEASVITDDEGTPASNKEVADSINKGVEDDSPKDAYAAEAGEKTDAPAPSSEQGEGDKAISEKAEAPESGHEQDAAKSAAPEKTGTLQSKDDSGPSNIGDARQQAKVRGVVWVSVMCDELTCWSFGRVETLPRSRRRSKSSDIFVSRTHGQYELCILAACNQFMLSNLRSGRAWLNVDYNAPINEV
ncbi:hypothetical protein BC629DRAFT_1505995 [Irpex lacteus]|nr:hypothetical protein BC629DRAFT_1505995 [Irpex lacteus]